MQRKPNPAVGLAWLLGSSSILPATPAFAAPPAFEEVLSVLGMDQGQVAELAQGHPVVYDLTEVRADELAAGIVWLLPVPLIKVTEHLRQENPDPLDVDVSAYGLLKERGDSASLAPVTLSREEAEALSAVEPGDEFNLSAAEIDSFQSLKQSAKAFGGAVLPHYREILFQRFKAYRRGGTSAIARYAREEGPDSQPSLELRQAANASPILNRYFPALHKAWLDYPQPLPPGAAEVFPWVEKKVENRPAVIFRHRISTDWDGGILVLTREFYAPHSYNSSQWITGCLPYRNGTLVFQQVRSYTDQVTGIGSDVKHIIGRKLLKDKMLKSFEHLCAVVDQCR